MIKTSTVLAVVSSEVKSSPLRQRDVRNVAGRPLLAWTIEAARQSRFVDRLVVYTANSETATVARILGADVATRSPGTASGGSSQEDLLALLKMYPGYDYLIVLDCASPLKRVSDIDCCIEICARKDGLPVVSVSEVAFDLSDFMLLDGERRLSRVFGVGDELFDGAPTRLYTFNPAIATASYRYLTEHKTFLTQQTHGYIMPKERCLQVQSKTDIVIAEALLGSDLEPESARVAAPLKMDYSANNI